jgi:hypothetical protein
METEILLFIITLREFNQPPVQWVLSTEVEVDYSPQSKIYIKVNDLQAS